MLSETVVNHTVYGIGGGRPSEWLHNLVRQWSCEMQQEVCITSAITISISSSRRGVFDSLRPKNLRKTAMQDNATITAETLTRSGPLFAVGSIFDPLGPVNSILRVTWITDTTTWRTKRVGHYVQYILLAGTVSTD